MAFDVKAFMGTNFIPREADYEIKEPALKEFFNSSEKAFWKLRGLTGAELGRANAVADKADDFKGIIEGMLSRVPKEKSAAVKKLLGHSDDVPGDVAKRMEALMMGSLDPEVDQQFAVKICETFPIEFYSLTTKIFELTGAGHLPGKPRPSGKMKKSNSH